eukprot:gene10273-11369_t
MTTIERIHTSLRVVPRGVRQLFRDTIKTVKLLQSTEVEDRTRDQEELIRTTLSSLKKVGGFIVLQAPPLIGLLPIAVAMAYPRQVLTHHFWTEEQKIEFLENEFDERKLAAERYLQSLTSSSSSLTPSAVKGEQSHPVTVEEWMEAILSSKKTQSSPSSSHSLGSADHPQIDLLARSQALYSVDFAFRILPKSYLARKIQKEAFAIIRDDIKLRKEGIFELDRAALETAVLRRGFSPLASTEELQHYLYHWLHQQQTKEEMLREESLPLAVATVHQIAHNLSAYPRLL